MKTAFFIDWFDKKTQNHGGAVRLDGIGDNELKALLRLEPDADINEDVFFVPDESVSLLAQRFEIIPIDPTNISYEIRLFQDNTS